MEDRIKSALEIALEKASKLGDLTPEEARELKWVPEGERLAALHLRGEADLGKALRATERSATPYVLKGILTILLRRLDLPRNDVAAATNHRVLETLRVLCKDQKAMETIAGRVTHIEKQYAGYGRQQLERSYQALRQQVASQVEEQLRQRRMAGPARVDVESMPQFQAQWRAVVANMERPYEQNLEDCRKQLRELVLAKPAFP